MEVYIDNQFAMQPEYGKPKTFRLLKQLESKLDAYAYDHLLSVNAAVSVLLRKALQAEGYDTDDTDTKPN